MSALTRRNALFAVGALSVALATAGASVSDSLVSLVVFAVVIAGWMWLLAVAAPRRRGGVGR